MEKKRLNNEGFSLIELIIVIAIMAILIGALAPQFMKYIGKARINSDKQLAESVRTAVITSLSDEDVTLPSSFAAAGYTITATAGLTDGTGETLWKTVAQSLGYSAADDLKGVVGKIKTGNTTTSTVVITITDSGSGTYTVKVELTGTNDGTAAAGATPVTIKAE